MNATKKMINIAPSSTEGHFIKDAKNVVILDELNETFLVEGTSQLVTKNHTTIENSEDCIITCQTVYDPYSKIFQKSKD
jgi:hypothetical protein